MSIWIHETNTLKKALKATPKICIKVPKYQTPAQQPTHLLYVFHRALSTLQKWFDFFKMRLVIETAFLLFTNQWYLIAISVTIWVILLYIFTFILLTMLVILPILVYSYRSHERAPRVFVCHFICLNFCVIVTHCNVKEKKRKQFSSLMHTFLRLIQMQFVIRPHPHCTINVCLCYCCHHFWLVWCA